MTCPSCHGAFPEGCSTCRPMPMKVGRVTFESPGVTAHTCPQCMRGLPCQPSLSAAVGHVVNVQSGTYHRSDSEWKRDAFSTTEVM